MMNTHLNYTYPPISLTLFVRIFAFLAITVFLASPLTAQGAIIAASFNKDDVIVGNEVELDLFFNFDATEATIGGGLDLTFDDQFLQFERFDFSSELLLRADPFLISQGALSGSVYEGIGFGEFNGLSGMFQIGTFTFTALQLGTTIADTEATTSIIGPFVSAITFGIQTVSFLGDSLLIKSATPPPPPTNASVAYINILFLMMLVLVLRGRKLSK